ncbi:4-aminobutyrate--2-oxoglutarate transaminase [Cronobacter malonaticus]|uniref:4-aminobutyrate--2-oxoglutarate transaminase n=1 Tax=Cronobacter malonaticus TaxID=413503 RepID=UPI000CFC43ED|nr:4-aminobutyrate--2-oxoglutarate transaminase [Cronobacter malonaticus]ELZ9930602.1 4-aminobutyrate--2-oxoglutarate transaminase [Cronobacter malonaticus]MBF4661025.1 4-aminobutyrate--2-oxoglutarate transaminase [Cronobacter malonaticus]MBF4838032.1 4-aminobutyrate--2-oxoglutarate transaminase [Cronobacter malonaticus]MBF4846480.1 4-aminobutyrate--2-oxoglutarate transaminase [Cronobacter malonaticus]MBF4850406.1 4-aminobutyrate--2-oxoglutarate transaminase [Cronobacter malonaticus]
MQSNQQWQERREQAVPQGVGNALPVFVARAKNAEIWDVEGRRYIDFASGIAVLNTGHNHPAVIAAVKAQLDNFTHPCFQVTPYGNYIELAERLNRLAPISEPCQTLFLSTGAEAVENAIKVARIATGRSAVIAFRGAFHGRTLLGMALTGKVQPYKKGYGPFPAGIYHAPYPAAYLGVSDTQALASLAGIFAADVAPEEVAAIIIEPVQGEGGFYAASAEFMQQLRALCDKHGIVLIVDEIQSGFCRTGKTFAIEHSGVEPDLITMAKSLAGGFPLSGLVGKKALFDKALPGGLGGTYAGSPVSIAAALAVTDLIEEEQLNARAIAQGELLMSRLQELAQEYDFIGDVRGVGAMVAMELVHERDSHRPDKELTQQLVQEAGRQGLILLTCGVRANVIRFLIPLTAEKEIVTEGLNILSSCLKVVQNTRPAK